VVVWSEISVQSDWVREEADDGLKRDRLVPIQIDNCQLPLGFRRIHALQLLGWPNTRRGLSEVIGRVEEIVGRTASPIEPRKHRRLRILGVGLLALIAVVVFGILYLHQSLTRVPAILSSPEDFVPHPIQQQVKFTKTVDGIRIAYATTGHGPPIVHVVTIFTNLENGLNSGVYDERGLIEMSSRQNLFVRYDGRGMGLSDRDVHDFSLDARVKDLEAVVDAAGLKKFALLGSSSGGLTAIAYTFKHPERVTRLVLAGAFAAYENQEGIHQFIDFVATFWDGPIPLGSDALARLFLPSDVDADSRLLMGEMFRRSLDGRRVRELMHANVLLDVSREASQISVPTLVIQGRDDVTVTVNQAQELAALIPDVTLALFDGAHTTSSAMEPVTRRRALEFLNTGN